MSWVPYSSRRLTDEESREAPRPYEFTWHADGHEWVFGRSPQDPGPQWEERDEDGPSLDRLTAEPGWALMPVSHRPGATTGGSRPTTPLRDAPSLFRTFASLDPDDRDAIKQFADTHGLLFRRRTPLFLDPPPADGLDRVPEQDRPAVAEYLSGRRDLSDVPYLRTALRTWLRLPRAERGPRPAMLGDFQASFGVETLTSWQGAIRHLRTAVRLWDLVRNRDLAGLNSVLVCHRMASATKAGKVARSTWEWCLRFPDDPPWPHQIGFRIEDIVADPGKLTDAERVHLQKMLNPYQPEWGEPLGSSSHEPSPEEAFAVAVGEIQSRVGYALYREVHPSLDINPATGQLVLRMHPDDLLTAMWLQFAQAVAGNKDYRQCRHCAGWFEVSTDDDARTARRLFCSDQCKSRDYRKRKDRAVELRAEGLKPAAIADKLKSEGLETEIKTVQTWVGRRRK